MARLPPETFRLPVERMREGYYTDSTSTFTRDLLELEGHRPRVLMQVFQSRRSILGGVDEAIAILEQCAGRPRRRRLGGRLGPSSRSAPCTRATRSSPGRRC